MGPFTLLYRRHMCVDRIWFGMFCLDFQFCTKYIHTIVGLTGGWGCEKEKIEGDMYKSARLKSVIDYSFLVFNILSYLMKFPLKAVFFVNDFKVRVFHNFTMDLLIKSSKISSIQKTLYLKEVIRSIT